MFMVDAIRSVFYIPAQFILPRRQFGQYRYMISDFSHALIMGYFVSSPLLLETAKINGSKLFLFLLCWHFLHALHRPSWHLQQSKGKYNHKLGQEKKQCNIPIHPQRGTFGHSCAHDSHYNEFWPEQGVMK